MCLFKQKNNQFKFTTCIDQAKLIGDLLSIIEFANTKKKEENKNKTKNRPKKKLLPIKHFPHILSYIILDGSNLKIPFHKANLYFM